MSTLPSNAARSAWSYRARAARGVLAKFLQASRWLPHSSHGIGDEDAVRARGDGVDHELGSMRSRTGRSAARTAARGARARSRGQPAQAMISIYELGRAPDLLDLFAAFDAASEKENGTAERARRSTGTFAASGAVKPSNGDRAQTQGPLPGCRVTPPAVGNTRYRLNDAR